MTIGSSGLKSSLKKRKSDSCVTTDSLSPSTLSSHINTLRQQSGDSIDSLIFNQIDDSLHSRPQLSTTAKNIHVSMNLPPTSSANLRAIKDENFNEATLTDDGIMITSQGHSETRGISSDGMRPITGDHNDSMTSVRSNSSFFETASLISCVTCLSDNYPSEQGNRLETNGVDGNNSEDGFKNITDENVPYSSVTGQLLVNTVIPYSRILHAKYLDNTKGYSDNFDTSGHSESNSTPDLIDFVNREDDTPSAPPSDEDPFSVNAESGDRHKCRHSKGKGGKGRHSRPTLVEVTFAKPRRHDIVPKHLTLSISYPNLPRGGDVVEEILKRSYKNAKRERSILVIVNPFGGKGKAKKMFMSKCKPILLASNCSIDTAYTKYAMHAVDIAREVDLDKYDTIACASGDGIPYEVINGLFQRPDRAEAFTKLAITQLPCGSGNAMSVSCHWTSNPSYAALCLVKSVEARIDLMCCSQPSYYKDFPRLSFLSQTYGVIAESDINTEFIRWMGPARFELGVAFNVLQRKKYPCDIYVKYAAKSKNDLKVHYLEHRNRASLRFENDVDDILNDNISRNYFQDPDWSEVNESDFKLKYPLEDGVPSDWERVDPEITENLGIFYIGKMPYIAADTKFFPAALPADGTMDLVVTDARTPVTRMAPILLGLDKGSHVLQPEVIHSKILAYKLVPKITNSLFSVDGEKFPLEPLQVEIMPHLCKTLLRNGSYVDTEFDSM